MTTTTHSYTDEQLAEIASELYERETCELPNGQLVRFRRDHDYNTDLNDFDYLGKVEPVLPDRYYYCYPHAERPAGFDGSARILRTRDSNLWWQPPTGWHDMSADTQRAVWRTACSVIEWGYYVYVVELCEGVDAYNRPIVRKVNALGGIEPDLRRDDDEACLRDLLMELLND